MTGNVAFNHVGQCVTDLERSKRFYCELLEFTLRTRDHSRPTSRRRSCMSLTPPLGMTACYLGRDGLVLELLHFAAVGQTRPYERTSDERTRPHALSLSVDDVDGCARPRSRVRRRGDRRRRTSAPACSSAIPTASSSSCCRWSTGAGWTRRTSAERRAGRRCLRVSNARCNNGVPASVPYRGARVRSGHHVRGPPPTAYRNPSGQTAPALRNARASSGVCASSATRSS